MYTILICPIKKLFLISQEADLSNVAAIVVSSYKADETRLNQLRKTLVLSFDDTTDEKNDRAFKTAHAVKIKEFVSELPQDLDTLFVCCDSGESRSSAIAAVIHRYFRMSEMSVWENPQYHPNLLVYKTLCDEFGVGISRLALGYRLTVNQRAFEKAASDV